MVLSRRNRDKSVTSLFKLYNMQIQGVAIQCKIVYISHLVLIKETLLIQKCRIYIGSSNVHFTTSQQPVVNVTFSASITQTRWSGIKSQEGVGLPYKNDGGARRTFWG